MKVHYFGIGTLLYTLGATNAAFVHHPHHHAVPITTKNNNVILAAAASTPDSAQAFTDYMAKSHAEKLKALKTLEDKKNSEIEELKVEINKLKSSSSNIVQASSSAPVVNTPAPIVQGSIEDLSAKLIAYQKFMSEYIVKAQQDKYNAVKAAEAATAKKYEDKLNALMLPGSSSGSSGISSSNSNKEESKLVQERNANVVASAKAGKSRWGDKEVQRVSGGSFTPVASESKIAASSSSTETATIDVVATHVSPDTIAAADHGLRADGGVGGLTLEERVTAGAGASNIAPVNGAAVVGSQSSLFAMRNARIAQAAKAGNQSRWGTKEESKAVETSSNILPPAAGAVATSSPAVEAADHGLRADGGVGGPSLAERVNLGAKLLQ